MRAPVQMTSAVNIKTTRVNLDAVSAEHFRNISDCGGSKCESGRISSHGQTGLSEVSGIQSGTGYDRAAPGWQTTRQAVYSQRVRTLPRSLRLLETQHCSADRRAVV